VHFANSSALSAAVAPCAAGPAPPDTQAPCLATVSLPSTGANDQAAPLRPVLAVSLFSPLPPHLLPGLKDAHMGSLPATTSPLTGLSGLLTGLAWLCARSGRRAVVPDIPQSQIDCVDIMS
jgi:hypothetical protein